MITWVNIGCEQCGLVAVGRRTSDLHIAERFGVDDAFLNGQPFLDGERIEGCVEACPGDDGYVICYAPSQEPLAPWQADVIPCPCGSERVLRRLARGHVSVNLVPLSGSTAAEARASL